MEASLFVAILFLGLIFLLAVVLRERRFRRFVLRFACRALGIELEVKGGA